MKEKIKSLISISIFSGIVTFTLYSFSNFYSNNYYITIINNKSISNYEKIKLLIIPDYIYGRSAKSVLIKHQLESDREETRSSYYRYINERIKINENILNNTNKDNSNI